MRVEQGRPGSVELSEDALQRRHVIPLAAFDAHSYIHPYARTVLYPLTCVFPRSPGSRGRAFDLRGPRIHAGGELPFGRQLHQH